MASEDALLLRSMRGFSRETGDPLDEPALRSQAASGIEQVKGGESLGDIRSRYDKLRSDELRPEYRGFTVPANMDGDQTDAWFASIDASEDERERTESLSYRVPKAMSEAGRYFLGTNVNPEEERRLQEEYGLDPVKGEPQFVKDIRGSGVRQIGLDLMDDPVGTVQKAKSAADEMAQKAILEDDPESARNLADIASLKDPTGASDIASAISSARLAYREPEKRGRHLADTAISGAAGGIQVLASGVPLVGSLLSGARLKAAMRGADVADDVSDAAKAVPDAPAPVFEAASERMVEGLPDKIGVQALESTLGRKKHSKSGEVVRYTKDVKDKNTGEIIHKKGDKKLTESGEEILYPDYIYKDISASEWNDTKLDDFINAAKASGKKSVTKDELIKHLDDNKVQIEEVRLLDNVPLPQDVLDLGVKKLRASRAMKPEVESLSGVLAPGENLGTQQHKFQQNPSHFHGLYVNYIGDIGDIDRYEDVPSDMSDVVNRLIDLERNLSVSDWKVEDAARITEARNAVNAKLADPEYQEFVRSRRNQMQRRRTEAEDDLIQADFLRAQNLKRVGRILDRMPEAESRLAALRKFENLPKYQEYSSLHRQHTTKLRAAAPEIERQRTKYARYTVPGGEDYQEILLTVPNKNQKILDDPDVKFIERLLVSPKPETKYEGYNELLDRVYKRYGVSKEDLRSRSGERSYMQITDWLESLRAKEFTESHHRHIPNVMAHIRFKTRIDSKGRRIMFIEEIQSDWHQQGLKYGYDDDKFHIIDIDGNVVAKVDTELDAKQYIKEIQDRIKSTGKPFQDGGPEDLDYKPPGTRGSYLVPDAPLKDTKEWTALAIKRIFREAADKGYDGVAFSRSDMITPLVTLPKDEAVALMGNPEAFLKRLAELKKQGGQYAEGAEQAGKVFGGNQYYYDKLIPSIAKKESFVPPDRLPDETTKDYQSRVKAARKARPQTTLIELEDLGFSRIRSNDVFSRPTELQLAEATENNRAIEVPFFELTDKVKDRVIKPQKLYSVALPGIAIGAAAAEEEELSAAAALGAIGLGGMALYKGMKGARAAKLPESPDEIESAFSEMARIQRGGPERAMDTFVMRKAAGGTAHFLIEHIGDLTNRLGMGAYGPVVEKIKKTNKSLPLGFESPPLSAVVDDVSYRKSLIDEGYKRYLMGKSTPLTREEWSSEFDQLLLDYANEHRTVPVYNEVQRLANDAAIALGEQRYVDARDAVAKLEKYIGEGEEAFRARMGRIEPEFARPSSAAPKPPAPDAATAGAKTQDEAEEAARLWREKGVESPYFKRWFGESKVLDDDGEALPVFHGTSGDFDEFRAGTPESAFGSAIYLSDNVDDVNANYARLQGSDIKNRVASEVERIIRQQPEGMSRDPWKQGKSLEGVSDEEILEAAQHSFLEKYKIEFIQKAIEEKDVSYINNAEGEFADSVRPMLIDFIARKRVLGNVEPRFSVMKTYVNIENPVYLDPSGTKGRTTFDYNVEYDEAGEIVDESGSVIELLEAIDDVAGNFDTSPSNARNLKNFIAQEALDGEVDAFDIFKEVKDGNYYFETEMGEDAVSEFIRQLFEQMGFDGIIADAYHFFGPRDGSKGFQKLGMDDVTPGTYHYMPFKPEQIKSATGNVGTFDPSGNILKGIGVGAAVPAAAAVRSQRDPEEGNPMPDSTLEVESRFTDLDRMLKVGGFGTLPATRIAITQDEETGNPSMEDGYDQSIDIGPVVEFGGQLMEKQIKADRLYDTMVMIESEYANLSKEDAESRRGEVLTNWYSKTSDEFSVAEADLEQAEKDRYFMGSDFYYDTLPEGVENFDEYRAFSIKDLRGPKIVMDIPLRQAQESEQRDRFSATMENGPSSVDLFGRSGSMNRYIVNKSKHFNHPVQSVQLNFSEKTSLKKDIKNVEDLNEAGLISFLLYKELIGDIELL